MTTFNELTISSTLVVAHPDDEVLWFSSVLEQVGNVIICFMDVKSRPDWSEGRRKSLNSYPLNGVSCLDLVESEVFNGAAWPDPALSEFGLSVTHKPGLQQGYSYQTYKSNYEFLKTELRQRLAGIRNVITHNPWGEYGHEEHVQVFRAIESLQSELGYRVWFSNYVSNKSHGLMLRYLAEIDNEYLSIETNPSLGKSIQAHYAGNGCWTWYPDYKWPETEAFIPWHGKLDSPPRVGTVLPMNAVRVEFSSDAGTERSWRSLPRRILRKARSAVFPRTSN